MSPQILPRLERLGAGRACERPVSRVYSLVKSHRRRVLKALATMTTRALVRVAVSVQVVFLEVYAQLKPDVACLAPERPLLPTAHATLLLLLLFLAHQHKACRQLKIKQEMTAVGD